MPCLSRDRYYRLWPFRALALPWFWVSHLQVEHHHHYYGGGDHDAPPILVHSPPPAHVHTSALHYHAPVHTHASSFGHPGCCSPGNYPGPTKFGYNLDGASGLSFGRPVLARPSTAPAQISGFFAAEPNGTVVHLMRTLQPFPTPHPVTYDTPCDHAPLLRTVLRVVACHAVPLPCDVATFATRVKHGMSQVHLLTQFA